MIIRGKILKSNMINDIKKSITLSFFELKIRNHNTHLGFFWYFLQPMLMFLILFFVKKNVLNTKIDDFVPYLLIGVIMVHFFITSTNLMMNSITSNYGLLNSKKINPNIFILSKFFVSLWIHLFESTLAILFLFVFGYYQAILYFIILPIFGLFIFGVGKVLCIISTKFFDTVYIWNYLCQLLWFVTPIYFVSKSNSFLIDYNPLNYFIYLARSLVYDLNSLDFMLVVICIAVAVISYLISLFVFKSQSKFITERNK